jgi:hypothetical protein
MRESSYYVIAALAVRAPPSASILKMLGQGLFAVSNAVRPINRFAARGRTSSEPSVRTTLKGHSSYRTLGGLPLDLQEQKRTLADRSSGTQVLTNWTGGENDQEAERASIEAGHASKAYFIHGQIIFDGYSKPSKSVIAETAAPPSPPELQSIQHRQAQVVSSAQFPPNPAPIVSSDEPSSALPPPPPQQGPLGLPWDVGGTDNTDQAVQATVAHRRNFIGTTNSGPVGPPVPSQAEDLDPAIEREIFEYGTAKEADGPREIKFVNESGQPVTFTNNKGDAITFTTTAQAAEPQDAGPVHLAAEGLATKPPEVAPLPQLAVKPAKSCRLRTVAGRAVRANNTTIILQVAALLPLLDEKLAVLREERKGRNDPDTIAATDGAIVRYETIRRDIEAIGTIASDVKRGKAEEKTIAKVTTTFAQGVRNWWYKEHVQICSKTFDAALFVSCVSLCSLVGCGGTAAVAVSGALVGGRPVIEALRALPKRFFKSSVDNP